MTGRLQRVVGVEGIRAVLELSIPPNLVREARKDMVVCPCALVGNSMATVRAGAVPAWDGFSRRL